MSDLLKTLPRRIKIGHYTWRVVVGDSVTHPEQLEGAHGLTDYDTLKIYIRADEALSITVDTVLHELDHAINYAANLTDNSLEEEYVTRGTTVRLDTYLRNPRLWVWMNRAMRELKRDARSEE